MKVSIGHSTILVQSDRRCVECGTDGCETWHEAERVKVIVGKQEGSVTVYVCGRCHASAAPLLNTEEEAA